MKLRLLTNILVTLMPHDAHCQGVLLGVAAYCREHGDVEVQFSHGERALRGQSEHVDGILTSIDDDAAVEAAAASPIPIVNVSSVYSEAPCPTVCTDDEAIGRMAAEHLLRQGYRQFAYHLEGRVAFSRQRLAGFRMRLGEVGHLCHVFDSAALGDRGTSPADIRAATRDWVRRLPKPVGLFTHSDVRASALVKICREAEVDVPNEAGNMGSGNDLVIGASTKPTLTSTDNAPDAVGYRAAATLIDLIRGRQPAIHRDLVPPRRVIERQSTQPAFVADEGLREAIRFIRAHAPDAITVSDVVRHVPLSRRTLERRFQECLARSPADEIRRAHFERARHLLAETSLKLSEVAIASGYSRFSSFAAAFRAAHDQTPTEYREMHRTR